MRADATRNLELVLSTGARLLAGDPSASIADIAAAAEWTGARCTGGSPPVKNCSPRCTQARYDAVEQAIDAATVREAPVAVALHRYVEGIIAVNRDWPVVMRSVLADSKVTEHRSRLIKEVDTFLMRAVDEGLLRADLPPGWINAVLPSLMLHAAEHLPDLTGAGRRPSGRNVPAGLGALQSSHLTPLRGPAVFSAARAAGPTACNIETSSLVLFRRRAPLARHPAMDGGVMVKTELRTSRLREDISQMEARNAA